MSKINSPNRKIACLVEFYRAIDRPPLEDEEYISIIIESADTRTLQLARTVQVNYPDKVEKFLVDGAALTDEQINEKKSTVSIELVLQLPPRVFFSDLTNFIDNSSQLSMGHLREDYYLIEENYMAGDKVEPHKVGQLRKVCDWIKFLQYVLPHTETRPNFFTFVLFPESKDGSGRSKQSFSSKISMCDLEFDLSKSSEFFKMSQEKEDFHTNERKSVFRQVLAELLDRNINKAPPLSFILKHMDTLSQNYDDSYERYINGFSIEKIKKEILEDYNQFSAQIRVTLNEIITKTFAVPASLAAAALMLRLDSFFSDIILSLVILLTTIITVLFLSWQSTHILQIQNQIKDNFDNFAKSGTTGAEFALKKRVELEKSASDAKTRVLVLRYLSWVSVIFLGFYLYIKYL
jgi:hypothetical protein